MNLNLCYNLVRMLLNVSSKFRSSLILVFILHVIKSILDFQLYTLQNYNLWYLKKVLFHIWESLGVSEAQLVCFVLNRYSLQNVHIAKTATTTKHAVHHIQNFLSMDVSQF